MIKLAIMGIENTHSVCFASVLAPKNGKKIFDDVELIGVYGDPNEEGYDIGVTEMKKVSDCPIYSDDYNRFLDEADAIMVTTRHGGKHFEYAKKYIEKGITVWVDKPFTCSVDELEEMVALAKKSGCTLCGASSLEYPETVLKLSEHVKANKDDIMGGHVTAPASLENAYGGFWFYTQHLIAMVTTVFGYDVKSVSAVKDKNGVHAIYNYDDFSVSGYFGTGYSVSIYSKGNSVTTDIITLPEDYFVPELKAYYEVLKSGKADKTEKQFKTPVYLLDATIKAYTENKEIFLNF